jgi:hypothetical protein
VFGADLCVTVVVVGWVGGWVTGGFGDSSKREAKGDGLGIDRIIDQTID